MAPRFPGSANNLASETVDPVSGAFLRLVEAEFSMDIFYAAAVYILISFPMALYACDTLEAFKKAK